MMNIIKFWKKIELDIEGVGTLQSSHLILTKLIYKGVFTQLNQMKIKKIKLHIVKLLDRFDYLLQISRSLYYWSRSMGPWYVGNSMKI